MKCRKCGHELPDDAVYCSACGLKQVTSTRRVRRQNGEGSVYKVGRSWMAEVTVGWTLADGTAHRQRRRKGGFKTKKAALEYLPALRSAAPEEKRYTFREIYKLWSPTHKAGKSTMDCYKSAMRWFAELDAVPIEDVTLDDLQECMDACPKGRRTHENMKALCGLLYKYSLPRGYAEQNLAQYLSVSGDRGAERTGFTPEQLKKIERAAGFVPYADYILCLCYTGFRPSEFLALRREDYDAAAKTLTGGSKTDAGRDRIVPVSSKIQPIVSRLASSPGYIFCDADGHRFTLRHFTDSFFYPALEKIGIENPVVDGRHILTPHSCRHTFATLLKTVSAPDADKLALIGHTSTEMLRYYQDTSVEDLRKIVEGF